MSYVGCGQGQYIQETTYKYVGCGGDFDAVRPRRDFTCLITTCCLLSLLLLPLLLWLMSGTSSSELFDCSVGAMTPAAVTVWSPAQKQYCCQRSGIGCPSAAPAATAPDTAAAACRPSRPFQLCSGHTGHVESGQEVMVLQGPPRRMPSANRPTDANASADA